MSNTTETNSCMIQTLPACQFRIVNVSAFIISFVFHGVWITSLSCSLESLNNEKYIGL